MQKRKPIRVGVVGAGRGESFMRQAGAAGMELVAICDTWTAKREALGRKFGIATYADYDDFLAHDLDAVVLANYFHEHAPFAIKALRAGRHVLSECTACSSLAEGVALCRAVEKSGRIYMMAENYPFTAPIMELTRLYRAGEIGAALYGEGEYNHPMPEDDIMRIAPGRKHWRNNLPATYYCTHALAPLMVMTDTMPVTVHGMAIPRHASDTRETIRGADTGAVIFCRMDNGAVFRLFGITVPGHSVWYRVHGVRGLMETVRGPGYWGPGLVRVVHDAWELKRGQDPDRTYLPQFPAWARRAGMAGHGGGDFFTNHYFAEAIRTGRQPYLDVYRSVAMSAVGILAWKSCLQDGAAFAMPDFKKESSRRKYARDFWSPFHAKPGPNRAPVSVTGTRKPSARALARARKVWREIGYEGA